MLNPVTAFDFTKPQYARDDGPDRFCTFTKDHLLNLLEESNWGQDVSKWREHFVLSPQDNNPTCRQCNRPVNHHHTDHSRVVEKYNFKTVAPVSCILTQGRLLRMRKGDNITIASNFVRNPLNGEEYCRTCNYKIEQHSNDKDISDEALNQMGVGGMMNVISGGEIGGDHRRTDLSAKEESFLVQRSELYELLHAERCKACPYSQEDLQSFAVDSCYERYKDMHKLYFKRIAKQRNNRTENVIVCAICLQPEVNHRSSNTLSPSSPPSEQDKWLIKSQKPCGLPREHFDNHRGRFTGQYMMAENPSTRQEVCLVCKHPTDRHDTDETLKREQNTVQNGRMAINQSDCEEVSHTNYLCCCCCPVNTVSVIGLRGTLPQQPQQKVMS